MEDYFIEALRLDVRFRRLDINLEKYSRTLKGKGYDINTVKHGADIALPFPASKGDYTVLIDPVRNFFTFEADTIENAIKGYEDTFIIIERSLGITKASVLDYILNATLRIETKGGKPAEMIAKSTKEVRDKLRLREIIDKNAEIGGLKIISPNTMITVDVWEMDPKQYLIRFIKRLGNVEDIKGIKLDNIISRLIDNIESESKEK